MEWVCFQLCVEVQWDCGKKFFYKAGDRDVKDLSGVVVAYDVVVICNKATWHDTWQANRAGWLAVITAPLYQTAWGPCVCLVAIPHIPARAGVNLVRLARSLRG